MAKIVISYRRADSEAVTGRIRDRLVSHYGQDSVFMDVDSIPFGIDFRDYIKEALDQTDALIVVMGTRWAGASDTAPPRIMEENDPVRIEVEAALARGIAVIPLLIDNATMPQPQDLPESLQNLAFRNAAHVESGRDFHLHMDRLVKSMDRLLGRVEERKTEEVVAAPGAPPPAAEPPQLTAMVPPPAKKRGWGTWVMVGLATPLVLLGVLAIIGMMLPDEAQKTKTAQPAVSQTVVVDPPPAPVAPVEPRIALGSDMKCDIGENLAFRDDFSAPFSGWDLPLEHRRFAGGQMVIAPEKNRLLSWLYSSVRYSNATICAVVRSPREVNKLDGWAKAGIVFLAADYENYYTAQVYLDGTYRVYRRLAGEWIQVVARGRSEHVRAGVGAVNKLAVITRDKTAEFHVNGHKLADFQVQPPENGGAVGLYGESEEDRSAEWRFLEIAAMEDGAQTPRPASARARAAATGKLVCGKEAGAAFADDFSKPDSGWGASAAQAYRDGTMALDVEAGKVRAMLYLGLRYASATACTNYLWPKTPSQEKDSSAAGIAFWASGYRTYYQASVYRDGTYDVFRLLDGKWLPVQRRTASKDILREPDAVNQVKVLTDGNRGTLYINSVKTAEFWGQPPSTGGAVGLFAQANRDTAGEWRFTSFAVID